MSRLSNETMQKLMSQLRRQEGCKLKAYLDTEGVWTIGVGHTRGVFQGMEIDRNTSDLFLRQDLRDAESDAVQLPSFRHLSEIRQAGLINMVFNLGYPQLRSWTNTMLALVDQDWRAFHKHAADSIWVDQVKVRAHEVLAQIRHDRWMRFDYG